MGLREFFAGREDFQQIGVVQTENGWDVVLRIDGSYLNEQDALDSAKRWEKQYKSAARRDGLKF
jgi:hypothetical protein